MPCPTPPRIAPGHRGRSAVSADLAASCHGSPFAALRPADGRSGSPGADPSSLGRCLHRATRRLAGRPVQSARDAAALASAAIADPSRLARTGLRRGPLARLAGACPGASLRGESERVAWQSGPAALRAPGFPACRAGRAAAGNALDACRLKRARYGPSRPADAGVWGARYSLAPTEPADAAADNPSSCRYLFSA